MSSPTSEEPWRTLISPAFEGDQPPAQLSVSIVSLVELCQRAMPDPQEIRKALVEEAKFVTGPTERAEEWARVWALENKLISDPVTAFRHELYGRGRRGDPVIVLLSVGRSGGAEIVFTTVIFRGATEADVVKAMAHVTKKKPLVGGLVRNADGNKVRRVFFDVEGVAGVRAMVGCGPDNVDSTDLPRAIIALNKVGASNR